MNRHPVSLEFDQRIADWLEEDSESAPGAVLPTVLAAFPSIPQRRASRVPWRFPSMSTFAKLAVAAVVVIAVGTVGIIALQPGGGRTVGTAPSVAPAPTPVATPAPTLSPSATAAPSMPPPLTERFTSPRNGISISYPAGWRTRPATQPWTTSLWPYFDLPTGDVMHGSLGSNLFIALASQPLAGKTGDQWSADILAANDCVPTEPVTIDGASGLVGVECNIAAVVLDGRAYVVVFYTSGDEGWLDEVYDRAWFEQLLTTIDLHPEDAVDAAPSPPPSSSP